MSDTTAGNSRRPATPWHLWLVGIIALLFNAFGALDYVLTQLEVEAYLSMLTDAQREYFDALPTGFMALFAIGVWSGVLAGLFLLFRSALATWMFILSLAAYFVSLIWQRLFIGPVPDAGINVLIINILVPVLQMVFIAYTISMTRRGVLR